MPPPKSSGGELQGAYYTTPKRGTLAKPWRAILRLPDRNVHLGYHRTEVQAHDAWRRAILKYRKEQQHDETDARQAGA